MDPIAVGVPVPVEVGGGWDFWLPLYVLLSFGLVLGVTGWGLTLHRSLLAVAGGTLWTSAVDVLGVIPAAANAVVVTVVAGAIFRRRRASRSG